MSDFSTGQGGASQEWRSLLLERLQKLESSLDAVRNEVTDVKTSSAVTASESKARADSMHRVEEDLKELNRVMRDIEKKLDGLPSKADMEGLSRRVRTLEDWQSHLTGRLVVWGSIASVIVGLISAILVKLATA